MQKQRLKKYIAEKKIKQRIAKREATEDKEEFITIDMPEVKDIPGQEKIRPPRIREMMDVTNSSADEEGEGILDDLNKEEDDELVNSDDSNVSSMEKQLLRKTDRPENDETKDRKQLKLDQTDGEDLLNEESNPSDLGADLDVPGAELDDDDEETGSEDEENNLYSGKD